MSSLPKYWEKTTDKSGNLNNIKVYNRPKPVLRYVKIIDNQFKRGVLVSKTPEHDYKIETITKDHNHKYRGSELNFEDAKEEALRWVK